MSHPLPFVLFGAFDRHNLGDILLAHMAAHELSTPLFAGLAERDLTVCSGQRVMALAGLREPMCLMHVGGELLDCDAAQAACMLGDASLRWPRRAPYVVACDALPAGSQTRFHAVGGVGLGQRDEPFRSEVLHALRQADELSVRDGVTLRWLNEAGIAATLVADPVTRVADVFRARILRCSRKHAPYVALQFAAECGDDATLAAIARGLERVGLPVLMFRAGAAPWHDAIEPYTRLAARLRVPCNLFTSLDVWEICGLIAGSNAFIGTSLHGRLVAEAFGVPALSLASGAAAKLRAYLETWQPGIEVLTSDRFADEGIGTI